MCNINIGNYYNSRMLLIIQRQIIFAKQAGNFFKFEKEIPIIGIFLLSRFCRRISAKQTQLQPLVKRVAVSLLFYAPAYEKAIRIFSNERRNSRQKMLFSTGEQNDCGHFSQLSYLKLSHVSDVDNTVADRADLLLVCFVSMHLFRLSRIFLPE